MKRLFIALLFAVALQAQAPKFDVASLKWAPAGTRFTPPAGGPGTADPEHFAWPVTALCNLIGRAFAVGCDQIKGPDWVNTQLASIAASVPAGATSDQFNTMLQNLFADRLQMTVHHESKTIDGYNLVVAKSGPKLKDAGPADPANPNVVGRGQFGPDGATLTYLRANMRYFANDMAMRLRQMNGPPDPGLIMRVIDKTELTGTYDISLHYALPNSDAPGQDLFGALESQLGLKLEPAKITIDMVVIDHIDRTPAEN